MQPTYKEVIQDARARILAEKLILAPGQYIRPSYQGPCRTCALGALLYSYIALQGGDIPLIGGGSSNVYFALSSIFTHETLALVEACFEDSVSFSWRIPQAKREAVERFHRDYRDFKTRALVLLDYLEENEGTFKIDTSGLRL